MGYIKIIDDFSNTFPNRWSGERVAKKAVGGDLRRFSEQLAPGYALQRGTSNLRARHVVKPFSRES
jgi:hypothetical protein